MKVDIHTHILPKFWPDLADKYGYGGWITIQHHEDDGKVFREVECNCWCTETRLDECSRSNVDVQVPRAAIIPQVLSTVPGMGFNYWAKPEHALDVAIFLNDHIAEVVSDNPKRFIGLGTVPMQCPERAVQELRRCMNDLKLAGVQIGSHVNDETLDNPKFDPFWKACEELNAAVFVHPWDMESSARMKRYWFPW